MHPLTLTIPSTGRPERLCDCLRSIDIEADVRVGAVCGDDLPSDIPTRIAERISFEFSIDTPVIIQNVLAGKSRGHVLPISDDIVFDKGAIQTALDALDLHFPDSDGVVGFNIKNMTEKDKSPYAFMLIGETFFNERLGRVLFYTGYKHFFADTELGEYADSVGKFKFCAEAMLTHFHPSTGTPADATHTKNRGEKWQHDHRLYQDRKKSWQKNGFAISAASQPIIQTAA